MDDEINDAGGAAAGERDDSASTATADTGAAGALSALVDEADGAAAEPAAAPSWRDDWREALAAGDEKELARLKRFASIDNLHKSYRQLEKRLSAAPTIPTLPKNATEEQVAEYRKAIGVPETPDGYGLKFDESLKPSAADTALLQGFAAAAHAGNIPAAHAAAMFGWYQEQMIRAREEQAAAVQREFGQMKAELKRKYGADHTRNVKILEEWLEDKPLLAEIITSNLHRKGVAQESIALALASAPEDALYSGDAETGGKSLDEQVEELLNLKLSGKATPAQIAKYDKLFETKFARDQRRAARGRAA